MSEAEIDPQHLSAPGRWPDPARPVLTFYGRDSGERTELSAVTLANWVAKTASLGTDLLGLEPGTAVRLALPTHWLGTVWVLAAFAAGWRIVPADAEDAAGHGAGAEPADVLVLAEATLPAYVGAGGSGSSGAREVVAVSTRPLARQFGAELPAGALDYAGEVSACADVFEPVGEPDEPTRAQADGWLHAARRLVTERRLTPESRLLTETNPAMTSGLIASVLAPALATASVVLLDAGGTLDAAWAAHIGKVEHAERLLV